MELLILLVGGIVAGVLIGLLPVFPVYVGAFILYYANGIWTPEYMLLFWIITSIGSQFFTSVSAITLGIPGDSSSLIYINDIKHLTMSERRQLLWTTGRGSLVGGVMSLLLVWGLYHYYVHTGESLIFSLGFRIFCMYLILFFFITNSKHRVVTILLGIIGLIISPQNNYSLPAGWHQISILFENTTFFMLVISLLLIPDLIKYKNYKYDSIATTYHKSYNKLRCWSINDSIPDKMPWGLILKNSIIGCIIGLIPGPAAELAASTAYTTTRDKVESKIIAAETANNPGVVMMILPLLLLGIPFTSSSLIVSNIMDSKMVDITELVRNSSSILPSLTIFDALIVVALITTAIYYLLSVRFINMYSYIVQEITYSKLPILLIIMVVGMVIVDIQIQQLTWFTYIKLLISYTTVGVVCKYLRVSPIPMIFLYLVGDQLIWATMQYYSINF